MSEYTTVIQQAHFFITEGRVEEALALLEKVQTSDLPQKRELAYLRAWCYMQREQWDEAAHILLSAGSDEHSIEDLQSFGQTERRRRAVYLLLLGDAAVDLGWYEEATRHYAQCIRFLDERRMNVVSVRIKARCGLGIAYTRTGFYTVALTHFEDALRLTGEDNTHPDLPQIYAGLCDAHSHLDHFAPALDYGKRALQLAVARADRQLELHVNSALGHICFQTRDFDSAVSYYTRALALATSLDEPVTILTTFTSLADIYREKGLLKDARHCCEQALAYADRIRDQRSLGTLYIGCGKVAEAEAKQLTGEQAEGLVQEAILWYQKAEAAFSSIHAGAELAEVYGRLAQLLETSGQQRQAIAYWKSAYSAYASPEASPVL
ncbi:MAG TPA: tetratricopeptide repeat protein [Ktedonobacteraceae bacterium]|jgi:tetratricopeptide (TPR) repeat protein|nr:tetratricopeptide repeat protein [Ktedonobacteraceae bacterium]